jgi:DNA-binding NtrC family response regulator
VLLDDFHHLRRSTQTLLLRVLDQGVFRRIGATRDLPVRCRVIIGLTESPDRLVERGALLPELRFRLGYSVIHLPSLEERREDIAALAQGFLARCPEETGRPGPDRFAAEVISVLQAAQWPGNLRQLEMVIRDAYLRAGGSPIVRLSHLPDLVMLPMRFQRRGGAAANANAVRLAVAATHGRVRDAARLLHTSRSTLYAYLGARSVRTPDVERVTADNLA